MKFNKELRRLALPEWRLYFINYKGLKRHIKMVTSGGHAEQEYWAALDAELAKVHRFYDMKMKWAREQLRVLHGAMTDVEVASPFTPNARRYRGRHARAGVAAAVAASDDEGEGDEEGEDGDTEGAQTTSGDEPLDMGDDEAAGRGATRVHSDEDAVVQPSAAPVPPPAPPAAAVDILSPPAALPLTWISGTACVASAAAAQRPISAEETPERAAVHADVVHDCDEAKEGAEKEDDAPALNTSMTYTKAGASPAPSAARIPFGRARQLVPPMDLLTAEDEAHPSPAARTVDTAEDDDTASRGEDDSEEEGAADADDGSTPAEDDELSADALLQGVVISPTPPAHCSAHEGATMSPPRSNTVVGAADEQPMSPMHAARVMHIRTPSSLTCTPTHAVASVTRRVTGQQIRFLRARKAIVDLHHELELLAEYLRLNDRAVYKIVKKWDKRTGHTELADGYLDRFHAPSSDFHFMLGTECSELIAQADMLTCRVQSIEPRAKLWKRTKAYTIGCFDAFHHGHSNLLTALRQFGSTVVVGIHDDESYRLLKGALPFDTLERRIDKIKPYVDSIFVIPSTDPTPFIQAAVTPADIADRRCVYVRGDDMPNFPARHWVERVMDVYLLPRTDAVSSSFIKMLDRASEDTAAALRTAFAPLDYEGKPILDDSGVSAAAAAGPQV